jgi:serine/threonine-protein phosphatase 6 regulatory ankyrin repeat subunit B
VVTFLIEQGADVDTQDVEGWTALILASSRGDLNSVRELIEAGADVNLQTVDGLTALDHARELVMDPPLVVEALLAAGAKGG